MTPATPHVRRFLSKASLGELGRDPWILAVLATESYFRRPSSRVLEYIAWVLLHATWPQRALSLTIGLAQVKLSSWVTLGVLANTRPSLANLSTVLSPSANYAVAERYLQSRIHNGAISAKSIAACYVGEARAYYISLLAEAHEEAVVLRHRTAPSRPSEWSRDPPLHCR
jgi:hypothetical protein